MTNDSGLALTDTTGSLYLRGGTIVGGTVTTAGGAELIATQSGGTLTGVTLGGTLEVGQILHTKVTVTGGLALSQGTINMEGNGLLSFVGSQALGGTGTVSFADGDARKDLAVPNSGDTLTIASGVTIHGDSGMVGTSKGGSISNDGTIASDAGGTITVQNLANFAGGTLTGGTWVAGNKGTLRLLGANIVTNAAGIVLDGGSSHFYSDSATADALAGLNTNAAVGRFTVQNGAVFTPSSGTFSNAGAVTVSGGTLAATGYVQTEGSTLLSGGTLGASPTATVDLAGGTLGGAGTIDASLTNASEVDLGTAPGLLAIAGNYTQTSAGTLTLKVGGAAAGTQFDQVNIAGKAALGGTLDVALINGFGPSGGQAFDVLNFAGSSGGFATFHPPLIGGSPAFVTKLAATRLDLVGSTTAASQANGIRIDFPERL
jgi:hypothetical protein